MLTITAVNYGNSERGKRKLIINGILSKDLVLSNVGIKIISCLRDRCLSSLKLTWQWFQGNWVGKGCYGDMKHSDNNNNNNNNQEKQYVK